MIKLNESIQIQLLNVNYFIYIQTLWKKLVKSHQVVQLKCYGPCDWGKHPNWKHFYSSNLVGVEEGKTIILYFLYFIFFKFHLMNQKVIEVKNRPVWSVFMDGWRDLPSDELELWVCYYL